MSYRRTELTTDEVLGVIQRSIEVVLGDDAPTVTADAELGPDGIGIDSLDLVEVVMEIEEQLAISFETDELSQITCVMSLVDAIKGKVRSAGVAG